MCVGGSGWWSVFGAFKVGRNGETISHLQFVDDTILFSTTGNEEVYPEEDPVALSVGFTLEHENVQELSGGWVEVIQSLTGSIHEKVRSLPTMYLGLLIEANLRSVLWDPVIENFEKKLSM